jgi:diguanylate cyclase (GGDEF)-like protein
MRLSAYSNISMTFLDNWTASAGLSTIVQSPFVALMGVCLVILLVLGGLWLKNRYPISGFRRRRSTEKSTELSSTYDHVTGLPTSRLFVTLLKQSIGRAAKIGRPVALLVVELEHFWMVAESQGHANGNVLVRVQAARVKGVIRSTETVARLAQDQLAMILDNLTSPEEVTAIVEKLQATVGLPLTLEGQELFLTCRIGVALYPQDATEPDELIKQAMRAVKAAKSEGQAVQFASPTVAVSSSEPVPASSPFAGLLP